MATPPSTNSDEISDSHEISDTIANQLLSQSSPDKTTTGNEPSNFSQAIATAEISPPPHSLSIHSSTGTLLPAQSSLAVANDNLPPANSDEANYSDSDSQNEEVVQDIGFVPTLGAWAKPLHFTPAPTPPVPATPRFGVLEAVKSQLASFWPSIGESSLNGQKQKKGQMRHPEKYMPQLPVESIPPPALKEDGTLRFPWAARMNQSSRNLFRAAEPTYRLDGTPQVTITSKVLQLGPESKEEYIVGQFHRCSCPPGGLIHAVLNRLWGRECKITCRKLGDSSFLFHIPHENTRKWVIQRGVWHIDDCLLFVAPWNPVNSLKVPELSTLPVGVTLKNIPDSCFSRLGISHIASGLGEPMLNHRPRLDPANMGEAKILVEVELDKPFPKVIALDDKQGNIYLVDVEYSWIPSACERCGALVHKEKRCLLPARSQDSVPATKKTQIQNEEVPLVDIDHLLQSSSKRPEGSSLLNPLLPSVHQDTVNTENSSMTTPSDVETTTTVEHSLEVHASSCSNLENTLPILAVGNTAPTHSHVMEEIPSKSIILESSQALEDVHEQSIGPQSPHSLNCQQFRMEPEIPLSYEKGIGFDDVGGTSSYSLTRGGRPIKPTQKIQDMEWTRTKGRGKRGRRGRGNSFIS